MPENNKKPDIRFKGFTDEWEEYELLDGTTKIGDGLHGTPKYIDNGGVFFINGNNLVSGKICISDETKQVSINEQSQDDKNLDTNTILMSINGTIGNLAYYQGEKVMLGKSVAYITLKKFNKTYIYAYLQTPKICTHFYNNLTGSTIKNLGLKTIRETNLFIPEKEIEQSKIGSYFQELDKLINLHQRKYDKLVNLKKAVLEKMFPKDGENVPEIRFKGFTEPWQEKTLGGIADFSRGKGLSWNDIVREGNHECVLYGHLYTNYGMVINKINYSTNKYSNEMVLSNFGDVLIPCSDTTPTGLARATSIEKSGVILGGDINILRPKSPLVGSFLSYNINSNRNKLIKLIKGTTVRHLDNSDLKTVEIFIPDNKEEQSKIAKYFKKLDELISLHQKELEKLKKIKKACLEKMFV